MSGLKHKKDTNRTILYGIFIILIMILIVVVIFLAMLLSGHSSYKTRVRQAAATPVEDTVAFTEIGTDEFMLPDSNARYLNEHDVAGWSASDIRIAKNEIYARHGRIFEAQDLARYFDSKSWYFPSVEPQDFQVDVFNDYEKKNVEYLADAQIGKHGSTSDTFTYQDSLGDVTFAFKYPVYWGSKVLFQVRLEDSGMVIRCVDVLNNKRGVSLYGDQFGTVFSFQISEDKKDIRDEEELICHENGLYVYLRLPETVNYLETEPDCVKSYENLRKEMYGVVNTFRIVQ